LASQAIGQTCSCHFKVGGRKKQREEEDLSEGKGEGRPKRMKLLKSNLKEEKKE